MLALFIHLNVITTVFLSKIELLHMMMCKMELLTHFLVIVFMMLQNSAEAWSMVSSQTIANCWRKTGILPLDDDNDNDDDEDLVSDDDMILDEYVFKFLFNILLLGRDKTSTFIY